MIAVSFVGFTKIFFALVTLIGLGIIFEKKIIALEDRFDEWWECKRKEFKNETY